MNQLAENSEKQRAIGRPFAKGQSGNPGGRPGGLAEFRAKCRERADLALETLEAECRQGGACGIAAAKVLLEFGYGRPTAADDERMSEPARPAWLDQLSREEIVSMARKALAAANNGGR